MFKYFQSQCQKKHEEESCLLTAKVWEVWKGRTPLLNGNEIMTMEQTPKQQ